MILFSSHYFHHSQLGGMSNPLCPLGTTGGIMMLVSLPAFQIVRLQLFLITKRIVLLITKSEKTPVAFATIPLTNKINNHINQ
jgi:hypothetical protein